MPIIIGDQPASDFQNPLGLLADCHRRIEKCLEVLRRIAGKNSRQELDEEHHNALESSLQVFSRVGSEARGGRGRVVVPSSAVA